LYVAVVADIPLKVSVPRERKLGQKLEKPTHISQVVVTVELAPKTIGYAEFEETVFRVIWTVDDLNGESYGLPIYNSFSTKSGQEPRKNESRR
jgi:hypothetical protein